MALSLRVTMKREFAWVLLILSLALSAGLNVYLSLGVGLLTEETVYSPEFSEKKFGQIACGMKVADVEALLGLPLEIIRFDSHGLVSGHLLRGSSGMDQSVQGIDSRADGVISKEYWRYAKQGKRTMSQVRTVEFDGLGQVVRTVSHAHVD